MAVLSDKWIKKMAKAKKMISPFVDKQIRKGKISFGLSSYGYDARVSNEFKIFTNVNSGVVDPKVFKKESFVTKIGKECIIPPNSFALASTIEYFKIPENVLVICLGEIYLCKMWYNRKCYSFRTRLGRTCHIRIFEYNTTTCKDLC